MNKGLLLAVDGGNSKTDVALCTADGALLAAVRGPTTSHQAVGLDAGLDRLAGLVADVRRLAADAPDAPAPTSPTSPSAASPGSTSRATRRG